MVQEDYTHCAQQLLRVSEFSVAVNGLVKLLRTFVLSLLGKYCQKMTATVSIVRVGFVLFTLVVCTVSARKCYVCDSRQNPGCSDANQISQLYQDCSNMGGFGGTYQQPGSFGQPGQQGGFGQQGGQFGANYGGDRCYKMMIVGGQGGPVGGGGFQNQPQVIRGCGAPPMMGGGQPGMGGMVGSDGCSWMGNIMTCSCDWNYCNGSTRVSTTSFYSLLAIAAFASLFSLSSRKP
ncbi:hypothetical protein RvY_11483 [Ramazzottius varieornatus]|uniref:Protein quiver n=1 Tax=Ramazzottius varieornatus TaxID=947166 RepID=A0A1D1VG99_RAMVA|nr:hypothetical protein RvY_11483 [Ramazzottius varieornatus]